METTERFREMELAGRFREMEITERSREMETTDGFRGMETTERFRGMETTESVATLVWIWIIPAISVIGTLLNVVILVTVTSQRRLRKNNLGLYMGSIALVDIGTHLVKFIQRFTPLHLHESHGYCRLTMFFTLFLNLLETCIVTNIAVERLFAVRYPLKHKERFGYWKAVWTLVCGTVACFLLTVPVFVTETVYLENPGGGVVVFCQLRSLTGGERVYVFAYVALTAVLPVPGLLTASVLIARALSRALPPPPPGSHVTIARRRRRMRVNTISLTAIPVTLAVTKIPILGYAVLSSLAAEFTASVYLYRIVCELLKVIYASVNLCYYCWEGTLFHAELVKLKNRACSKMAKRSNVVHVHVTPRANESCV